MELNEEEKGMLNELWPNVSTIEGARWAAKRGGFVALIVATLTFVLCVASMSRGRPVFHITAWSAVDGVLFLLITARLLGRPCRIAAVAGLGLYIGRQVYQLFMLVPFGTLLAVFAGWYMFHAVRAGFSYHRLTQANPPDQAPQPGSARTKR